MKLAAVRAIAEHGARAERSGGLGLWRSGPELWAGNVFETVRSHLIVKIAPAVAAAIVPAWRRARLLTLMPISIN